MSYGEKKRTNNTVLVIAATIAAMLLPIGASAQVVISEIMYDYPGTEESGKHDWVEIFNSGSSAVSLSEWRLRENDADHQINPYPDGASATLSAGGYAVIANDTAAFKIDFPAYGGLLLDSSFSLVSSGETLVMRCCGSNVADRTDRDTVSYTPVDSATDQGNTLQRTSISGGTFISMSPTPGTGALGSSGSGTSDNSDTDAATTTDQGTSSRNGSGDPIAPPPPKVFADGGSDRTVIVGADTEFRARAYDQKKNSIDFSSFHWNFGDGSTADTGTVLHRFDYPGRYVVVLDIPEEKDSVSDQVIVTVEPMKLVLSLMSDGGVAVENRAGRTLDLSRWIIRSMGRAFTVPDRTFVLANTTLRISQRTLGFSGGSEIELAYPNGVKALGLAPEPTSVPILSPAVTETSAPAAEEPQRTSTSQEDRQTPEEPAAPVVDTESTSALEATSSQIAAAGISTGSSSRVWWLGAFGIAGLAAGSLALARRYGKKEWDIEEMGETR